jgi:hypothetical protein
MMGMGQKPERGGAMGIRYLSILPMAIFSLALQAQAPPTTAAQAEHQIPAAAVSAELTKRIDTKNAKQGDEVEARVTDTAKLPDGTELPRGTKLKGKVTDVKAKSKEDKSAHLAFNIDQAVLKDGKELPVVVIVMSVTGPSQGSSQAMMPGGGAGAGASSGSSGSSGSGSSGSGSSGSMGSSTASTPSAPVMSDTGQSSASAGVLRNTQDRVPVGNMPGVILSAAPGMAGTLDAAKDNINLDSGTKLMLSVAPGGSPVGQ